jgi:hypothetical protein
MKILYIIAIPLWMASLITAALIVGMLIPFERVLFPDQFTPKPKGPHHD